MTPSSLFKPTDTVVLSLIGTSVEPIAEFTYEEAKKLISSTASRLNYGLARTWTDNNIEYWDCGPQTFSIAAADQLIPAPQNFTTNRKNFLTKPALHSIIIYIKVKKKYLKHLALRASVKNFQLIHKNFLTKRKKQCIIIL